MLEISRLDIKLNSYQGREDPSLAFVRVILQSNIPPVTSLRLPRPAPPLQLCNVSPVVEKYNINVTGIIKVKSRLDN